MSTKTQIERLAEALIEVAVWDMLVKFNARPVCQHVAYYDDSMSGPYGPRYPVYR